MKLTVTGIEKVGDFARISMGGKGADCIYSTAVYTYVPWADRGKYELESEFEMELWAVMEEPADQREDTPEREHRPGGVMNNGL